MCEIGLLSSVPNAWEKYTIIMLYLQGGCCCVVGSVSFAKGWIFQSRILNSILYHKKLYP
jgi:hypothetical protein